GPPLRRRVRSAAVAPAVESEPPHSSAEANEHVETPAPTDDAPVEPAASVPRSTAVAEQAAQLRALLAEVGPRRGALAERLGAARKPLSERVLLARFRAAGLERELGQRERDLLRGLFARHGGARDAVAAELKIDVDTLQRLVRERGLEHDIEELTRRFRQRGSRRR
ncbi:MAG TPA: hypothetical protein VG496_06760, partial [Myxococcales bacterium]|nr:hypothetical protein [Myxococcales bacterium]